MSKNDKGILIIAAGHPYYGQLALNLCLSLKYSSPGLPVAIARHGESTHRIETYMHMFDQVIQLEDPMVTSGGNRNYLKAKVHAYDITPFKETALIDADVIWHPRRSPEMLLNELKAVDFTIGNRNEVANLDQSFPELVQWANPGDLSAVLGHTGKFYNLSSEFIYWKQGDTAHNLFETAKRFFEDPGVPYKRFAGGVPDELPFQMALATLDMAPHAVPFLPFYWEHQHKKMLRPKELYEKWWGYSMGGNHNGDHAASIYNNLASWYYNHWGLRFTNPIRNKRDIMPERKHI